MATLARTIRVLVLTVATAIAATAAAAATSDPPVTRKAGQAAAHAAPQAHAPATKPEPAPAKPSAEGTHAAEPQHAAEPKSPAEPKPAAGHGESAGAKKSPKPDRKAIEAEVRQVVSRINSAMTEASEKPVAKPTAKTPAGAQRSPGHGAEPASQGHPTAKKKSRPAPLLVWDDTLKPGNVKLVWDPDVAPRAVPAGARLSWGDEKK